MKDALVPLASVIGALLLFGSTIIVALIGRRRKPTEVSDYMTENRGLRGDLDQLRTDFDEYRTNKDKEFTDYKKEMQDKLDARDRERRSFHHLVAVVSDALDAAWSYVNVLKATMADAGINAPEPSAYVRMATEAARDIRTQSTLMEDAT